MESILLELQNKKCWKSHLKTISRRNKINPLLVNAFTIIKLKKFKQQLDTTQLANKARTKSTVWLQNELKAYHWFLLAMSSSRACQIDQFGMNEWKQLSAIFNKEESILHYEALKLIKQRSIPKRTWEQEQIDILLKIIKQDPQNNKWNQIARTLFHSSDCRYFRTGKQCRERWLNHLDPQKKHGQWQNTEDRQIVSSVVEKGKKWSEISKQLQNQRTQHMVKNRFKTLTIMLKKQYPHIKNQRDLLTHFLSQKQDMEGSRQLHEGQHQPQPLLLLHEGEIQSDHYFAVQSQQSPGELFDKYIQQQNDQMHQCLTPRMIYQTFTPNIINTPNSLTFLMNYSFDHYDEHQHLFLKNN